MEELAKLMSNPGFLQFLLAVLGVLTIILQTRSYRSNKRADIQLKEAEQRFNDRQAANERRIENLRADNSANLGMLRVLESLVKASTETNENATVERAATNDTMRSMAEAVKQLADSNRGVVEAITEFRAFSTQQHSQTREAAALTKTNVETAMGAVNIGLTTIANEMATVRTLLNDGSPYLKDRLKHIEKMINAILETMPGIQPLPDTGKLRAQTALDAEAARANHDTIPVEKKPEEK